MRSAIPASITATSARSQAARAAAGVVARPSPTRTEVAPRETQAQVALRRSPSASYHGGASRSAAPSGGSSRVTSAPQSARCFAVQAAAPIAPGIATTRTPARMLTASRPGSGPRAGERRAAPRG